MKMLFFDAGPIISLTLNNLLWTLKPLKEIFDGKFYITPNVKKELIDVPLQTKKFKFEALQVMRHIREEVIEVYEDNPALERATKDLIDLANSIYIARKRPLRIVHPGEMQTVAAACLNRTGSVIIDERTTRLLIENPYSLSETIGRRVHEKIKIDSGILKKFQKEVCEIKVLRSTEIALVAYEKKLLDSFMPKKRGIVKDPCKELLLAVLWGLKLRGCSISQEAIDEIIEEYAHHRRL